MIRVSLFAEHEREAVAPSGAYRLQMSPPCGTGPYGRQFRRRSSRTCAATEANGTPIAAILTGANRNDVTQRIPVIEAIEPINGVRGRPLSRPKRVYADRGYGRDEYRRIRHARGIPPSIARRGNHAAAARERFNGSLSVRMPGCTAFCVSVIRFERRADIHEAFLKLGCGLICGNSLQRTQLPLRNRLRGAPHLIERRAEVVAKPRRSFGEVSESTFIVESPVHTPHRCLRGVRATQRVISNIPARRGAPRRAFCRSAGETACRTSTDRENRKHARSRRC
ncbi:ISJP4 transposase [Burkholderia pseudomallei]|nr:ISJP4 transposase [Burkholderia pseudomallei]VCA78869.1 ISJP4 transposase [Burkholderia pseudomallei]VCA80679.1 ISJP4 transposase [Burkholderia pseudomallei]VCA84952.1 ISJP4 transposase [Burkholderia pseudomallei]VCA92302.1 ISJP4 transposase [Burkholderia pseudomallei]